MCIPILEGKSGWQEPDQQNVNQADNVLRLMRNSIANAMCLFAAGLGLVLEPVAQPVPQPQPTPPASAAPTTAQTPAPKPQFPPFTEVLKDYSEVISTIDNARSLLSLWTRTNDNQVIAALPPGVEQKKFFIALTVASGERYAGL